MRIREYVLYATLALGLTFNSGDAYAKTYQGQTFLNNYDISQTLGGVYVQKAVMMSPKVKEDKKPKLTESAARLHASKGGVANTTNPNKIYAEDNKHVSKQGIARATDHSAKREDGRTNKYAGVEHSLKPLNQAEQYKKEQYKNNNEVNLVGLRYAGQQGQKYNTSSTASKEKDTAYKERAVAEKRELVINKGALQVKDNKPKGLEARLLGTGKVLQAPVTKQSTEQYKGKGSIAKIGDLTEQKKPKKLGLAKRDFDVKGDGSYTLKIIADAREAPKGSTENPKGYNKDLLGGTGKKEELVYNNQILSSGAKKESQGFSKKFPDSK